jgi:hypothetical protein
MCDFPNSNRIVTILLYSVYHGHRVIRFWGLLKLWWMLESVRALTARQASRFLIPVRPVFSVGHQHLGATVYYLINVNLQDSLARKCPHSQLAPLPMRTQPRRWRPRGTRPRRPSVAATFSCVLSLRIVESE